MAFGFIVYLESEFILLTSSIRHFDQIVLGCWYFGNGMVRDSWIRVHIHEGIVWWIMWLVWINIMLLTITWMTLFVWDAVDFWDCFILFYCSWKSSFASSFVSGEPTAIFLIHWQDTLQLSSSHIFKSKWLALYVLLFLIHEKILPALVTVMIHLFFAFKLRSIAMGCCWAYLVVICLNIRIYFRSCWWYAISETLLFSMLKWALFFFSLEWLAKLFVRVMNSLW